MSLSDEQKASRKHTIKAREHLQRKDELDGTQPTRSRIIQHPRANNPPPNCRDGKHGPFWDLIYQGVPARMCKKCGAMQFQNIVEKTLTKREIKSSSLGRKLLGELDYDYSRRAIHI